MITTTLIIWSNGYFRDGPSCCGICRNSYPCTCLNRLPSVVYFLEALMQVITLPAWKILHLNTSIFLQSWYLPTAFSSSCLGAACLLPGPSTGCPAPGLLFSETLVRWLPAELACEQRNVRSCQILCDSHIHHSKGWNHRLNQLFHLNNELLSE